jgi:hypothetical protein
MEADIATKIDNQWQRRCNSEPTGRRFVQFRGSQPERQLNGRYSASDKIIYRYGKYYNIRDGKTKRILLIKQLCLTYIDERTDEWASKRAGTWSEFNERFTDQYDGFDETDLEWLGRQMMQYVRKDNKAPLSKSGKLFLLLIFEKEK